jgi:flagellin FlaB
MKANVKFFKENERGDAGVGTFILFIAMVLVAAVAASILINNTEVQQKATKASKEATQQISSNIVVEQILIP